MSSFPHLDALARERKRARQWWRELDTRARGDLGDAFALGSFDWREWFGAEPTRAFLAQVEECRVYWEITDEDLPA